MRPLAERMVTLGKKNTLHARRTALSYLRHNEDAVQKLFADVAPRAATRNGGYTRIIKLAPRKGDAAPMVLIEIVEGAAPEARPAEEERRRRLLRRRGRPGREQGREQGRSQEEPEETAPPASAAPEPEPGEEAATDGGVGDEEESPVDE